MIPDLTEVFHQYRQLCDQADNLFAKVSAQYPSEVRCRESCSDCCNAVFDLSLVEAMNINRAFQEAFKYGPERSAILEKASATDRGLTKVKREMYRAEKAGESVAGIMRKAAELRSPCPLLTQDKRCVLYEQRPITCRLYGIPLDIGGQSHVCGCSDFAPGKAYPAVKLSIIQEKLESLSRMIGEICASRFDLGDVYVPLSMALLTKYDDAYLGIGDAKPED